MKKYLVSTGGSKSTNDSVSKELHEAGFKWANNSDELAYSGVALSIGINVSKKGVLTYEEAGDVIASATIGCKLLAPSQILNGGAQKLDGAKVVEPRWFLGKRSKDVVKSISGVSEYLGLDGTGTKCVYSVDEMESCSCKFVEITKQDIPYIRDNAEKAKELGMVLRKPEAGDDIIGYFGMSYDIDGEYDYSGEVAGHRYCRKAEAKPEAPKFCHQCATPITPDDSKFCRMCAAEL